MQRLYFATFLKHNHNYVHVFGEKQHEYNGDMCKIINIEMKMLKLS